MKSVYIEMSVVSYLASRPSRDLHATAWQQITCQWWAAERAKYELFTSELVVGEASVGHRDAAKARLYVLEDIEKIPINEEVKAFAVKLMDGGAVPPGAEADALHIAVACVHEVDYLLTWNFRHIDNAASKPIIRSICAVAGYACPEICTPLELLWEEEDDVQR